MKSDKNLIYKFGLKDNGRSDRWSVDWMANFEVQAQDDWKTIQIPFEDFEATWRGSKVYGQTLKKNRIRGFILMYTKFDLISWMGGIELNPKYEEGDFQLYFKDIGAYN